MGVADVIVEMERTIQVNNLQPVKDLASPGQLIPLLIGATVFADGLWPVIDTHLGMSQRLEQMQQKLPLRVGTKQRRFGTSSNAREEVDDGHVLPSTEHLQRGTQ